MLDDSSESRWRKGEVSGICRENTTCPLSYDTHTLPCVVIAIFYDSAFALPLSPAPFHSPHGMPSQQSLRWLRGARRYFEPGAAAEALVAIGSAVLLWMGWWNLTYILLPPQWYWCAAEIIVGILGLFATRSMYDKAMLRDSRADGRADTSLESIKVEVPSDAGGARVWTGEQLATRASASRGAAAGNAEEGYEEHLAAWRSHLAAWSAAGPRANSDEAETLATPQPTPPPRTRRNRRRRYFDAPRPDARRGCRALFALLMGISVWTGFWNGVALCLPAEVVACCASAEADPGPKQLVRAPWCVLAKVTLMALGTCGLWATRSLYGDRQVHGAQHQRMR